MIVAAILRVAVLVTVTTHRTVSTVNQVGEVAAIVCEVKKHVVITLKMCSFVVEAVPVFATVVWVRKVSIRGMMAVFSMIPAVRADGGRQGGCRGGWCHTVLIAITTYRPISAIHQVGKIATIISQVIQLVFGAGVVGIYAIFDTLPVLPTVKGVRPIPIPCCITVKDMATVRCGRPLCGGVAVCRVSTGTVPTVNIKWVGAPLIGNVVTKVILALTMCEAACITLVVH